MQKIKLLKYVKGLNYILSPLQMGSKAIFITGHGRSGTTWIGNTFKQAPDVLYYGEPCNPKVVEEGEYSHWFRYIRPNESDHYFESYLDSAFKGLITYGSYWLMKPYRRFLPGYRIVIKEVASLLLLEWVYKRYHTDVLFVLRHPCDVALSEKNKNTSIDKPKKEILKQSNLIKDHLSPYVDIIQKAKTPFEIYGVLWGARNRVIADLIQKYPEWKIVFYEDLCNNPVDSFRDLFDHFGLTWTSKVQKYINRTTVEKKPGRFSIYRITKNQANKWKRKMNENEIDQIRSFVEPFNLPFYNLDSDWSLS